MKKAKYISNPFIYLSGEIMPILGIITTLIVKDYYALIFCVCIFLLWPLPIVFMRKLMFRKMLINEEGFTIYYGKSIVNKLLWKDIKDTQVLLTGQGARILFSDKPLYVGKERWRNYDCIFVNFKTSFAIELYKYKDKIPVEIKGFEKLPKYIRDMLS